MGRVRDVKDLGMSYERVASRLGSWDGKPVRTSGLQFDLPLDLNRRLLSLLSLFKHVAHVEQVAFA